MIGKQKMNATDLQPVDRAIKYFTILSAMYDLNLTKRQICLLGFTAIRGTITPLAAKKDFTEKFKSPVHSINNMISELSEKGLLVKENGMQRLHPKIKIDFNLDLVLEISLYGAKG